MVTKEEIISKLEEVYDPELGIDVWTLELIYGIEIKRINNKEKTKEKTKDEFEVNITMTLTTPACPFGQFLIDEVEFHVLEIKKVKKVNIKLTFDPLWQPSEELRAALGV